MNHTQTLLLEIGTEELPPRAIGPLAAALGEGLATHLQQAGFACGTLVTYSSPRRLAVTIDQVPAVAASLLVERRGPPLQRAFDATGAPTPAASGFARSCGTSVANLIRDESSGYLLWREQRIGMALAQAVGALLPGLLESLPIPKRMRWGAHPFSFVRPVHWLVCLHGADVLPVTAFGLEAGRTSCGHRFHAPGPVELAEARGYAAALENAYVVVEPTLRRQRILAAMQQLTAPLEARPIVRQELLDEVANLVEWPVAALAHFDSAYLDRVPREVILATLEGHQRYFALESPDGTLLPHFIFVANIASCNPTAVRQGQERVVRPRLADAAFFLDQDRVRGIAAMAEALQQVVYQEALGTLGQRAERLAQLAQHLAPALRQDEDQASLAAFLAKADLVSAVVAEFPELQGIMGGYYAAEAGYDAAVSRAIAQHYQPRHSADPIPASPLGCLVALTDRLDQLCGFFAIGKEPSGEQDPFALRRAAAGVVRLVLEHPIIMDLPTALQQAIALLPSGLVNDPSGLAKHLFDYILQRLRSYCLDKGLRADAVAAALAIPRGDLTLLYAAAQALHAWCGTSQGQQVVILYRRAANLLRQAGGEPQEDGLLAADPATDPPAQQTLAQAVANLEQAMATMPPQAMTQRLEAILTLQELLERFFTEVMVMVADQAIRHRRLALLARIKQLAETVGDLSLLHAAN